MAFRALLSLSDNSDNARITPPTRPAGCGSIEIYAGVSVVMLIQWSARSTFSMLILVHSVIRLGVGHEWIDQDFVLDMRSCVGVIGIVDVIGGRVIRFGTSYLSGVRMFGE